MGSVDKQIPKVAYMTSHDVPTRNGPSVLVGITESLDDNVFPLLRPEKSKVTYHATLCTTYAGNDLLPSMRSR